MSRVETSTPSGMFTREVHATAHVDGPIRRETYERVAAAVREYRTQERTGAFGSPAEVWVEGSIGRAPLPSDEAALDLVASWVEELADVSDPVTGYEIDGITRYHIALTTDDPLAAAHRYATGDGALASDPDIPATFTAARPGPDARTGDGLESVEVPLGDPDTASQLDALERSSEVAGRGGPALLRLFNETVSVAVEGQKPAELVGLHADVAEVACDHLGVSTRSGAFSVEGCGDLTGARELVASLRGFDLTSFEADTNPDAVQVVGVREVDDLLAVTELDLEDRLYLVKAGSSRTGLVSVTGTTADMRALAPVAAAAAGDGREVTAARAASLRRAMDLEGGRAGAARRAHPGRRRREDHGRGDEGPRRSVGCVCRLTRPFAVRAGPATTRRPRGRPGRPCSTGPCRGWSGRSPGPPRTARCAGSAG